MRQVHDEEVGLLLNPIDDDNGFAKIRLRISGRMCQGHKHLLAATLTLTHVILDDRIAAGEPMLGPKLRIPEYPPTDSDNMRPLVPGYPPTCDALP